MGRTDTLLWLVDQFGMNPVIEKMLLCQQVIFSCPKFVIWKSWDINGNRNYTTFCNDRPTPYVTDTYREAMEYGHNYPWNLRD